MELQPLPIAQPKIMPTTKWNPTKAQISQMGNPLEQLAALVDFEMFRSALEDVLVKKDCKTPAGRPQLMLF